MGLDRRTLCLDLWTCGLYRWAPGLGCCADRIGIIAFRWAGRALGLDRRALCGGLWALRIHRRTLGGHCRTDRLCHQALGWCGFALGQDWWAGRRHWWACSVSRRTIGIGHHAFGLQRGAVGLYRRTPGRCYRAFRVQEWTFGLYCWTEGVCHQTFCRCWRALRRHRRTPCNQGWAEGLDLRAFSLDCRTDRGTGEALRGGLRTPCQVCCLSALRIDHRTGRLDRWTFCRDRWADRLCHQTFCLCRWALCLGKWALGDAGRALCLYSRAERHRRVASSGPL
ncbi:MAG: hypothetical protein QHH07_10775, partial [Sedimentisphaerales bacterium]|nr:hypothetical protein [Sedimentisphaerales bacterium]